MSLNASITTLEGIDASSRFYKYWPRALTIGIEVRCIFWTTLEHNTNLEQNMNFASGTERSSESGTRLNPQVIQTDYDFLR